MFFKLELPKTSFVEREIEVLDFISSSVINRKFGVIYIPKECSLHSEEILSSTPSSTKYLNFIKKLGVCIRLKDYAGFNGGLDTSQDLDGKFTVSRNSETQQIIFHVATMMPNIFSNDKFMVNNKKRHLGNDNVHIVFNESETPYDPNTLSGEFNFVQIEINPLGKSYYRIIVHKKEDLFFDGLFSFNQIVTKKSLIPMLLSIAINADNASMSKMEKDGKISGIGNYSNLAQRLLHIKKLKNLKK